MPPPGFGFFELPPPDTKRWGARRKAIVVVAVRLGILSIEEACQRYRLSTEEFLAWQRAFDRHGVPGLRTTQLQIYRDSDTGERHPPNFVEFKLNERVQRPGSFARSPLLLMLSEIEASAPASLSHPANCIPECGLVAYAASRNRVED